MYNAMEILFNFIPLLRDNLLYTFNIYVCIAASEL
jgi:hypothetical protein